jgi:hypothetical protein
MPPEIKDALRKDKEFAHIFLSAMFVGIRAEAPTDEILMVLIAIYEKEHLIKEMKVQQAVLN